MADALICPPSDTLGLRKFIRRETTLPFDPRKIFDLSGWLVQALPEADQRALLAHRLGSYLNGNRRGKLRLPRSLVAVQSLTEMSRTQLRKIVYWCKPAMTTSHRVSHSTADFLHRVAPMRVWTRTSETLLHSHSTVGIRLPKRCKPRASRPIWPSSPDLFEIVEMSRRGVSLPIHDNVPIVVDHHITRSEVKGDIRLASRIVATNIVGLRNCVKIPEKFLGSFRAYCGFSILVNRYALPAGLVRFLIAQWLVSPTSLWLVEPCPFKIFLKRHRVTDFVRRRSSPVAAKSSNSAEEGVGSPISKNEPGNPWSIYEPRLHIYQETLLLDEISRQMCFPRSANRHPQGPPCAVR